MSYEFKISLRGATENQMNANIMAIGSVTLVVDGQDILELRDFNVKRTRAQDKVFAGAASKSYKNREGETKWAPLYKVFPGNMDAYNALSNQIVDEYTRLGGTPVSTITTNSAPSAPASRPAMQSQPLNQAFPTAGAPVEQSSPAQQITPAPVPAQTPPAAAPPAMGAPVANPAPSQGAMPNPNPSSSSADGWPFS